MWDKTVSAARSLSLDPITWKDKMMILSPMTWLGIVCHLHLSPFSKFRIQQIIQGILRLTIPYLVLLLVRVDPRLVIPFSPWTYHSIRENILPPIQQITTTIHHWKTFRKNPLSTVEFQNCLETNRCIRYHGFDLFLPPPNHHIKQRILHGILLLPGALVAHTAYAPIASRLAAAGQIVVVVSMEPCRMATPYLGASVNRLQIIQQFIKRKVLPDIHSWSIIGHSLGSFAAMAVAKPLNVTSLVLWASGNFPQLRTDLSHSSIPMLILQGSNDKLCPLNAQKKIVNMDSFPPHAEVRIIDGAGHNGFAMISQGDPEMFGIATISMEQHQRKAADITLSFIRNVIDNTCLN
jgi:dienelactone hydrolase